MTSLQPPELGQWIQTRRSSAKYDLASSSAAPISVADLLELSESRERSTKELSTESILLDDNDQSEGAQKLRDNLAALYSARAAGVTPNDIILTSGPSAAIYTVFSSLLTSGDHVICQHPMNELLWKVPTTFGAEVTAWTSTPGKQWAPDFKDLESHIRDNTKLIVLQSPCDPTGMIVRRPVLEQVIDLAAERNITIVADETYRPLFHSILPSNEDFSPSTINFGYKSVVVIGSIGTSYSLPGIQIGWIASRNQSIVQACNQRKHFTSPSVSKLDESVAAEALSDRCIHALLARNIRLCQTNLEFVQAFITEHNWACSWAKPLAGTTALVKFHKMGKPVDSEALSEALLSHCGILVTPASKIYGETTDLRGYVRISFGGPTATVEAALVVWKLFMEEHYDSVPTVSVKANLQNR